MTEKSIICGGCDHAIDRAHKVYREIPYCNTCYSRLFKRRLCGGCGMFSRLFVREPDAVCTACIKKQPCVRCRRFGQPLGKLTANGPACSSCRTYFVDEEPCERCNRPSARLSRRHGNPEAPRLCPGCNNDHHTCSSCRRSRSCTATADGRWICKKCAENPSAPCGACGSAVAAGANGRCEYCYWTQKCSIDADQLSHMVPRASIQKRFKEFAAWAATTTDPKRTALALPRHVAFFVKLAALPERNDGGWRSDDLLGHFGTQGLRTHLLAARWLSEVLGVEIGVKKKIQASEARRFEEQLSELPEQPLPGQALMAFHQFLSKRVAQGDISVRTARLSFRPALDLASLAGDQLPAQDDVTHYLMKAPGQRAALFAFATFLRETLGVNLAVPTSSARTIFHRRRRQLEVQIRQMLFEEDRSTDFDQRWRPVALMYFHWISLKQAQRLLAEGKLSTAYGGVELEHGAERYWIPDPSPMYRGST